MLNACVVGLLQVGHGKYEPLDNSSQLDLEIGQDSSTSTSSLRLVQSLYVKFLELLIY